jgi:cyclopropane-fatty-acyl-phospholipid synthase
MWQTILQSMLRAMMRHGALLVRFPDGSERTFGEPGAAPVRIAFTSVEAMRRIVLVPQLAFGETYMEGGLTVESDDIRALLQLILRNISGGEDAAWLKVRRAAMRPFRALQQVNRLKTARSNVAHHYDLSPALYDLFLDRDRQYSCAYFHSPEDGLDAAQEQKKAHIARKLLLRPGMRVLDIGCGWGGLALTLARDHGARVVGVTLSEEQLAWARARAEREGLSGQVEFRLQDYREVPETFDRVVSVGMFEHVGIPNYGAYFRTVRDRLAPDGVALVHTIGHSTPPGATNPWIRRYIFPGGYIPSLSDVVPVIERTGLWITDLEFLRLHYAWTLRHWFERFSARMAEAEAMHDARFVRMWRFYLAASEASFLHGGQEVFQFQLSRRLDAVPVTRDYLYVR